jgi:outer membrane assembly lipoprotein YfiO
MLNSRKLYSLLLLFFTYILVANDTKTSESSSPTESHAQQLDLMLPSTDSKKQKSRMRKTHGGKNGEKTRKISTYREMTYEELQVAKEQHRSSNSYMSAIKYLDQMIKLCDDVTVIGEHLLEIADLLCLEGLFEKAAQKYAEYVALYPGGEKVEYALCKAIENSFACTLSHDRDQTKTEETLALAEAFLKQDHLNTYNSQVLEIRDKCYQKLVESELNICAFYVQRGRLKPAEKRLTAIRDTWLSKLPDIEPSLIVLETDVATQKNALEQQTAKTTLMAQNKKHMTERF